MIAHLRLAAVRTWRPGAAAPTPCIMSLETVAYQEAGCPALCKDIRAPLRLPVARLDHWTPNRWR